METSSYFDILGVSQDATIEDIKTAYRRVAMLYHPDKNQGSENERVAAFQLAREAYATLIDEELREAYIMGGTEYVKVCWRCDCFKPIGDHVKNRPNE